MPRRKLIPDLIEVRKKSGRKPKERPICAMPGCTNRVKTMHNAYCCQSHAKLGRPRADKVITSPARVASILNPQKHASFIETADDIPFLT